MIKVQHIYWVNLVEYNKTVFAASFGILKVPT